jgi:hypothetical protein
MLADLSFLISLQAFDRQTRPMYESPTIHPEPGFLMRRAVVINRNRRGPPTACASDAARRFGGREGVY